MTPGDADLADYTRSIERLNTSLGFLQTEMQRLAQQQEKIMAMREQQHQQAWVIPAPAPSPHRYFTFYLQILQAVHRSEKLYFATFQSKSNHTKVGVFFMVPSGSSASCAAAV